MKDYEYLVYENAEGETITFGIGSEYHVNVQKDVSGISDLTNTIYSSSSMNQAGNTYVGQRFEPREIDIDGKIKDLDKADQLTLRREALRILNPELEGTLYYHYGEYSKRIGAKVKGSPKFSHKSLSQDFSITFICLDPFWRDSYDTQEELAQWMGEWSFPCAIEEDDATDMVFARQRSSLIVSIDNVGDVSTGLKIVFTATASVTNPYLYSIDTGKQMKINYTMATGDTITVDGAYGHKSITLRSNGVESNIFRYMDPDSEFLPLDVGTNTFRYGADSGEAALEALIYYSPKYLGV